MVKLGPITIDLNVLLLFEKKNNRRKRQMRADVRRQMPLAQAVSEVHLAEAGRSTLCPSL